MPRSRSGCCAGARRVSRHHSSHAGSLCRACGGQNSLLRIDPEVVLSATGGAPFFVGVTVVNSQIPALALTGTTNLFIA